MSIVFINSFNLIFFVLLSCLVYFFMIFSKALIEFVHPKYVGKCQSHIAKEFNLCICPVLECYKDVGSMLFIQDLCYFFVAIVSCQIECC